MRDDTAAALTEVADHLAAASARLHDLAARDDPTSDPEAEAEFLRGARRELAELIHKVEGPNPPRGARNAGNT